MGTTQLSEQRAAVDALAQLLRAFGHLPGACIGLSPVTPAQIDISVHDDLADFEAWREALAFPADGVERKMLPSSMLLAIEGQWAGAALQLSGFAPLVPAGGAS
jgi:hypothetical protein